MTGNASQITPTAAGSRVIAVLQARMSSTRLPGKAMLLTCGKPMLQHQIERLQRSREITTLVVATSLDASDDAIEDLCRKLGVAAYRGSLGDVLDRMVCAARPLQPDWMVRLTGDCPLADPEVIDLVIRTAREAGVDYASNALNPSYPDGLDAECIRFSAMLEAWREAAKPSEREHVTPFIHTQPARFSQRDVRSPVDLSHLRWTVDEPADFVFVSQVYEHLYRERPDFSTADVLALLQRQPGLSAINGRLIRNEGYQRSLDKEAREADLR
jgi:spore coat polysaccharide biosynthesis protein SpsF